MELENTVEDQMCTSLLLLKNPFSWIVVLAPLITFVSFMLLGSLSIFFTSAVLIFSTVLFILSKRKLIHKSIEESSPQVDDISASKQQPEAEISKQYSEDQEGGSHDNQIHDYIVKSSDVLSENECATDDQLSTTEGSEMEWPFRDNMDRTPDWSDEGSISDEDSLIEISLPGGHYLRHKEDQANNKCCSVQQKLPDFMPESIFQQRSLMEILAEFNDMNEENLIEIDISMGSIKSSRFEIEA